MNLTPRPRETPRVTEARAGVKESVWVPSPLLESLASLWSGVSYWKGSSQRWNKEPFSFWRTRVLCGTGKDWTNPPEAWAATVTRIWDFPSEGFTLNLLPKASPRESVWTQQSGGFKVTVTFLCAWEEMENVTFLFSETPIITLYRSQEHRGKRPGPGIKRPGLSFCPCQWWAREPSLFASILFQRGKVRNRPSTLVTSLN